MQSHIWHQWMAGTEVAPEREGSVSLRKQALALGIPEQECTPAVTFALSALFEKIDDLGRELRSARQAYADIEQMVDVDVLAPIPNRRAFMRRLTWAINMFHRYGHPSTVLFFDLNGFKQINDELGHAAGDLAIRHVSHLLSGAMRESDFLARIGGDEFAVIMYYAGEPAAQNRGVHLVKKIETTPFSYNDRKVALSAAYGCHTLLPEDTAETALSAADKSMYLNKRKSKKSLTA